MPPWGLFGCKICVISRGRRPSIVFCLGRGFALSKRTHQLLDVPLVAGLSPAVLFTMLHWGEERQLQEDEVPVFVDHLRRAEVRAIHGPATLLVFHGSELEQVLQQSSEFNRALLPTLALRLEDLYGKLDTSNVPR